MKYEVYPNNTYIFKSYLIVNTLQLHYKEQPVATVQGNNCCSFF